MMRKMHRMMVLVQLVMMVAATELLMVLMMKMIVGEPIVRRIWFVFGAIR